MCRMVVLGFLVRASPLNLNFFGSVLYANYPTIFTCTNSDTITMSSKLARLPGKYPKTEAWVLKYSATYMGLTLGLYDAQGAI